jgi:hypothetical protein
MAAPIYGDEPLAIGQKLALAAEIAAGYARARLKLRRGGLRPALAALRSSSPEEPAGGDPVVAGRRLGHAVARTLAVLPADSRCLMRSLVLTALLARRGIDSRLVIAVQPGEAFAAHAWVEHDGVALLPTGAGTFEQLVTL